MKLAMTVYRNTPYLDGPIFGSAEEEILGGADGEHGLVVSLCHAGAHHGRARGQPALVRVDDALARLGRLADVRARHQPAEHVLARLVAAALPTEGGRRGGGRVARRLLVQPRRGAELAVRKHRGARRRRALILRTLEAAAT